MLWPCHGTVYTKPELLEIRTLVFFWDLYETFIHCMKHQKKKTNSSHTFLLEISDEELPVESVHSDNHASTTRFPGLVFLVFWLGLLQLSFVWLCSGSSGLPTLASTSQTRERDEETWYQGKEKNLFDQGKDVTDTDLLKEARASLHET